MSTSTSTSTSTPTAPRIAMLGLGSMNGAILAGLLDSSVAPEQVQATTRSAATAEQRATQFGISVLAEQDDAEANRSAAGKADIIFLGVKPHGIVALAAEIASTVKPGAVVVSVAAAISVDMIEAALPQGQPVIRSMPNTPLSVGLGVVGLVPGTHVSPQDTETVAQLLGASGAVHVIDESQIDALTGISGSGPAYAFYLAEAMAEAGVELGLDRALAADLAAQTIYGAGKMLVEHQAAGTADAAGLRRAVCSPNGTTERAINAFDEHDLPAAVRAAVNASAHRSAEITDELRSAD
ncbi:pyrroline-5-carboxylate reductase [Nesterenkonia sp. LB17]|uniref:pyrroline-5-carboxylate reductase n=1 Tax=unclassified Nesterenkonia TaxID=2629769 RepID=UPI001F4CAB65|nr:MULTISPECIES: pyrroline-5-carboxylate reductase [unclassified Nesterenkonia]MCH8561503.1 pyrroline-5-carboxylate reductase [Nesterenkonia sp. DZ6]MCH8566382.1 pyrroline-5-carboxylate reductase [Nesterenkonia sp. LB17]